MIRRRTSTALAAVALALTAPALAGCGGSEGGSASALPDVQLTSVGDGSTIDASELRGPALVNLWATWCGPCVEEIPGYIALQKKYGPAGLAIIGVSLDRRGPAHVRQFAQAKGMNYTLVMGDEAVVEAFGDIQAIPTTFLVSREGRILHQKTGAAPAEEYEKLVQAALK